MIDLFLYHLTLCLPLFLLVLLGWALAYFKAFSAECSRHLSDFTFRFLMPVMLFDLLSDLSDMPPVDWRVLVAFFTSCFFVHLLHLVKIKFYVHSILHEIPGNEKLLEPFFSGAERNICIFFIKSS